MAGTASFDFSGANVLVFGGTSGINLGIAEAFARAGAAVGVVGRNEGKAEAAAEGLRAHGTAQAFTADVRDPAAVEAVHAAFAESFGLALLLAAPFILGGFLFQALSGVINRVMPSLPVAFIGAPAAILLALAALALFVPMIVSLWADSVLNFTLPRPR